MADEITVDNYKTVDIESIALDRNRLGSLAFEKANGYLKRLQELFTELDELGYQNILTPNEVGDIDNRRNVYIEYLNRIRLFDINQPDPGGQHDQLEQEIENFYNDVTRQLRPPLTALRQEVALKNQDQKSLQREQKQAQQAKKAYDDLSKQLSTQIKKLEEQQSEVETGRGQLASKILAKHFNDEARYFETEATKWLKDRNIFFWALVSIVIFNLAAYCILKTGFLFFSKVDVNSFFNQQYLAIKLAIVALLSYGLTFSSKHYRINSNLAVINRHRRSVAQTIEDYLGTNPRPEIQDQIVKEGVSAMFQNVSTGYLSGKEASNDGNPATEFITNIIKTVNSDNK